MFGKKNSLIISIFAMFIVLVGLAVALTGVVIESPGSFANWSGVHVLNATTNGSAVNVTFRFENQSGQLIYNLTILNTSLDQTSFSNVSFNTSLVNDGRYNLTVESNNVSGEITTNVS